MVFIFSARLTMLECDIRIIHSVCAFRPSVRFSHSLSTLRWFKISKYF